MGNHEVKPNDRVVRLVRTTVHDKILRLRAFERLCLTPEFAQMILKSDDTIHQQVWQLYEKADADGLKALIKEHSPQTDLRRLSYRELRDMAKQRGIFRWSRLTQEELVEVLSAAVIQRCEVPAG